MEAERRQVTVLFTDMVGFTTFSERSGEEAAYTLMRSLSKLMGDGVREEGGIVRGFTGDGVMAVFGAPVSFEDAPLRACRAALAILQRLKEAGSELEAAHGVRPQMRIGLNTGAAVVGQVEDDADAGVTVLGDTVNFAARLQAMAEPDTVFMSEATHRMVQGMVEDDFVGNHQIKGKLEPQRTYRLNAIRHGATRFQASISRGLSTFVGRERELEVLQRGLNVALSRLCVVDLVAEPGMGKSRLLHEFRQRIGEDRASILSGSCSPDGQQTPFLPFIEVVRNSFRISAGEAETDIAQKLEMGLTVLDLHSQRNLGLLLHLLGLKVADDALVGLDGLLIGLRTRELLQQLLEARCRLSPAIMVIEDLHWIDSVSEELLGKMIDSEAKLRLLLITTRRPEYAPTWLDRTTVTKLPLDPLPTGDIRHLAQARLGVEALPEALARQVTEKADGNPLFAEEIITFLTERGILRTVTGKLDFDVSAVAAALPSSVQGILTARVDRLAPNDRALLQAAAVIGRRFDPQLLAAVARETDDVDARLAAMQPHDLLHMEGNSCEYSFKHALVRDALYQSLLAEPRKTLHLKIAEEIERRSDNRLTEVAEVLAHHYCQTYRSGKAFTYLSMAGAKNLSVYSLDEASAHFTAAIALLDNDPNYASDDQVADFLISYSLLLNLNAQVERLVHVIPRYLQRIDRLGDDPRVILIRHHFICALYWNSRYRDMPAMQQETSAIARRLGDTRSMAYSLASEICVSTVVMPKTLEEFEKLKEAAIKAVSGTADPYIQGWTRFAIGWEELHRGRLNEARTSARDLMQVGRQLNDPRSIGLGLSLLTWIALGSDAYAEALEYSEQALAVVVAPQDQLNASNPKGCALVLLRRIEEGQKLLNENRGVCVGIGYLNAVAAIDGFTAIGEILKGNIAYGIKLLKGATLQREEEGYPDLADWYRIYLAEVYLQIIGGSEKPSFQILVKNLPIIIKVTMTASSRIRALMKHVLENRHLHPAGYHVGRAQMILGLLYKAKKKRELAHQHLAEAHRIISRFGQTPILARVDAALAELG